MSYHHATTQGVAAATIIQRGYRRQVYARRLAEDTRCLARNRRKEDLENLQDHEEQRRQEAGGKNGFPDAAGVRHDVFKVKKGLA